MKIHKLLFKVAFRVPYFLLAVDICKCCVFQAIKFTLVVKPLMFTTFPSFVLGLRYLAVRVRCNVIT